MVAGKVASIPALLLGKGPSSRCPYAAIYIQYLPYLSAFLQSTIRGKWWSTCLAGRSLRFSPWHFKSKDQLASNRNDLCRVAEELLPDGIDEGCQDLRALGLMWPAEFLYQVLGLSQNHHWLLSAAKLCSGVCWKGSLHSHLPLGNMIMIYTFFSFCYLELMSS